jgi:transcriptional regulator with GAF, ATPase, and Fis domain
LDKQRYKKARRLNRELNRLRHEQDKKINILCNDIVSAHTDFVNQLTNLTFTVNFYESILGRGDLSDLLHTAVELVRSCVPNSSIAVFLVNRNRFELHAVDENEPIDIDINKLESYFSSEVVGNICRSNKVCSLDDMFEMGLIGNLAELGRISAAAIPLGQPGPAVGFMLIYRSRQNKLTPDELRKVVAVAPALCRAIKTCCASPHLNGQTVKRPDG